MQTPINPFQAFSMKMLTQPRFAWVVICALACFDMTAWLALTLVCLIILRHGVKAAWNLMCATLVIHGLSLYWFHPNMMSWVNDFLDIIPGYVGAIVLLRSGSWYWTSYGFVGTLALLAAVMDLLMPDFPGHQLQGFLQSLQSMSSQFALPTHVLTAFVKEHAAFSAHALIGAQLLSATFNAIISLTMARSLQSQLFYPQGFHQEMMNLRGCRWLLIAMFASLIIVWNTGWFFPLYLIPTMMFYFFCVGLSVGVSALSKNRTQIVFFVLTAASIFLPYVFIPLYVLVGAADSFVNFRHFLAKRVKYTF